MAGIDVDPQSLRSSARSARLATENVGSTRFPDAIRDLAKGMPGARALTSAERAAEAWHRSRSLWVRNMERRADALDTAAEGIEANERTTAEGFDGTLRAAEPR